MKNLALGAFLLLSTVAQADISVPLLNPMHFAKIVEITHASVYARDVKITYELKCNEEFVAVIKEPTSSWSRGTLAVGVIVNTKRVFGECDKSVKTLVTANATFDVPDVVGYLIHPLQPN